MMTEQRFVLDKLYYTIMTPIEKISVGRNYMTYGEVVGCLNEQQSIISELKKENNGLKEKLDDVLELTEFVGMTSLRKAEIKSIVNR